MLGTENLSLDQAPPISIPMRFFLTAPLFGVAAALLLIWHGPDLLVSRWAPQTLALTHLLTIGFLGLIMCGALLQMLPVLAGIAVPRVVLVGRASHLLIAGGTIGLATGLLLGAAGWLRFSVLFLGVGFSIYILAAMAALWRVKIPNATVTGMRMAVLALLVTVLIGVDLASGLAGWTSLAFPLLYTDIHLAWGILGWIGLLLIGAAFQVVPMFQVTPEYPQWMQDWMPRTLLVGLAVWTMQYVAVVTDGISEIWPLFWLLALLAGYIWFAVTTMRLQQQRRRKIFDVTLMFWRIGIAMTPLCGVVWIFGRLFPTQSTGIDLDLLLGVCMILGVAVPLLNGMLYKIVPFLSWFHLQNRQLATMCMTVQVPNMKQLLPDRAAKRQLWLYALAFGCTVGAVFIPAWFARLAGVLWAASFALLGVNLFLVLKRYREVNMELAFENAANQ